MLDESGNYDYMLHVKICLFAWSWPSTREKEKHLSPAIDGNLDIRSSALVLTEDSDPGKVDYYSPNLGCQHPYKRCDSDSVNHQFVTLNLMRVIWCSFVRFHTNVQIHVNIISYEYMYRIIHSNTILFVNNKNLTINIRLWLRKNKIKLLCSVSDTTLLYKLPYHTIPRSYSI